MLNERETVPNKNYFHVEKKKKTNILAENEVNPGEPLIHYPRAAGIQLPVRPS